MTKVYISPSWYGEEDTGQGGIKRVWEAMVKYLPEFGIEVVRNPNEADVIATHGGQRVNIPGIPSVNHNHGLMWSRYPWGENYQEINAQVVDAMRQAVAHTAPSEWVATSLRRGMLVYPEVVYHGVDADEWAHDEEPGDYVLWNKARADNVSNPQDMQKVANKLPSRQFVTTIGRASNNVKVTGVMPYEEMKLLVKKAGVYLATARETFGINTIEALAAGVPVAGWDWGGQKEIVKNGETGHLATPGNYDELAVCIEKCFADRERLSANAIADTKERWRWRDKILQYANIYKRIHNYYSNSRPKVSVIVTAYNLDKYLPECLQSIADQTLSDFECIVVDDALSETTQDIVTDFSEKDNRFKYRRPKENLGLSEARNFGLTQSKALYIRHMDADDRLKPNALELEAGALDADWGLHIAYGHLENINEDGSPQLEENGDVKRLGWPYKQYSWRMQMAHLNQLPSTCMVRRRVFENSGGYRKRMKRAEDAEFWCRVTSQGFVAKKVTQAVTMEHRMREDSKGAEEWRAGGEDGDWTAWFPWRAGAHTNGEGHTLLKKIGRSVPNSATVPFGAQGEPPEGQKCWPVHDFAYPVVSVIVTVGPGHEKYIRDSLDSVLAQTYPDWECIVVNDTGKEWNMKSYWDNPLTSYPWAKYVSTKGNFGASRARNIGAREARGSAFIWLDADDYWLPWLIERLVAFLEGNNGIIYSDHFLNKPGEDLVAAKSPEFDCDKLIKRGQYPGSSVLVPRWIHETIIQKQQGWDENIPGMEDWDYQIAASAHAGACAYRVEEPLFVYRYLPDGNREKHKAILDDIMAYIDEKWLDYRQGSVKMGCGCGSKKPKRTPQSMLSSTGATTPPAEAFEDQTVLLEYFGESLAAITIRGPITRTPYRFGLQPSHKKKFVYVDDAKEMLAQRIAGNRPVFMLAEDEKPVASDIKAFLVAP